MYYLYITDILKIVSFMKGLEEKKIDEKVKTCSVNKKTKKVSKTLEAARRLKGSLIVNDPKFLL